MPLAKEVEAKSSTTLYRKQVSGGKARYVPVAEEVVWDSLPYGVHVVSVAPGSVSRRFNVPATSAELLALLAPLKEELVRLIREASEPRPAAEPLTPAQLAAWGHLAKVLGPQGGTLAIPSATCIAEKVLDGLASNAAAQKAISMGTAWLSTTEELTI